jgi:CubicO group peptidase (beta-lactamase class C family)
MKWPPNAVVRTVGSGFFVGAVAIAPFALSHSTSDTVQATVCVSAANIDKCSGSPGWGGYPYGYGMQYVPGFGGYGGPVGLPTRGGWGGGFGRW